MNPSPSFFRAFVATVLSLWFLLLPAFAQISPGNSSARLTSTYVGYGSAGGVLTGSSAFTYSASTGALVLNAGADTSAQTDFKINPATKSSGTFIDAQVAGSSKIRLQLDSDAPTYGRISLNDGTNGATGLGIVGKQGDSVLYYDSPTGGQHKWRIAGVEVGHIDATSFSAGAATFSGAVAIGNTVNSVSPTAPNRTITIVVNGTTYYLHAKTTND